MGPGFAGRVLRKSGEPACPGTPRCEVSPTGSRSNPLDRLAVHVRQPVFDRAVLNRRRKVSVRSRDVSPSWAGCAAELVEAVALWVPMLAAVGFNALVDQAGA